MTWTARSLILSRRAFAILFSLFFVFHAAFALYKVPSLLASDEKGSAMMAATTSEIARWIDRHPNFCYGGTQDPALTAAAPTLLLFRSSCIVKKSAPLYGIRSPDGRFALARQEALSLHTIPPLVLDEKGTLRLTAQSLQPTRVTLSFSQVPGEVVLAYRRTGSFLRAAVDRNYFLTLDRLEGEKSRRLLRRPLLGPKLPVTIALQLGKGEVVVFDENVILAATSQITSLDGRMGYALAKAPAEIWIREKREPLPQDLPTFPLNSRPEPFEFPVLGNDVNLLNRMGIVSRENG
jgi:hypothetical protein